MKRVCFFLSMLLACAAASAAQAGPRDDVMARAARCFSLAEDTAWLNCYYAAAQPMQAGLSAAPGAPAAPPPLAFGAGSAPPPRAAASAGSAPALAFGAAPAPRSTGSAPPLAFAGAPTLAAEENVRSTKSSGWFGGMFSREEAVTPQQFGGTQFATSQTYATSGGVDHITARLTDYYFTADGRLTFTLDNGQVWQQTDAEKVPLTSSAKTYVASIKHSFFGAYNLTFERIVGLYHVRRMK